MKRFIKPLVLLAGICVASAALMVWAAWTDSATHDEVAHISAGYGYVRYLDYNLNPEHPPLVKALAGLGVLFVKPDFPIGSEAWQSTNDETEVGQEFLYQSGNNADAIIHAARIPMILITIAAIAFIYLLAAEFLGEWWALLPAFLFGFNPTVLAIGHYVTMDGGLALGVVASFFFFLKFLEAPSRKNLWLAGIALGLTLLTKFPAVILIPLFILFAFVQRKTSANRGKFPWQKFLYLLLVSFGVVYLAYALFTANYPIAKQVADTRELLATIVGSKSFLVNALASLSANPVLRPVALYLVGLLMSTARVGSTAVIYFLGDIVAGGGWYYFPVTFFFKESLPSLVVIAGGIFFALSAFFRNASSRSNPAPFFKTKDAFAIFAMAAFVILYLAIATSSPLDSGVRYLLSTMPFIYILAAYAWRRWGRSVLRFVPGVLGVLLLWTVAETALAAPYFLSYFNELGGGTWNGYRIVDDSNYDWGQDLLRLKEWLGARPVVSKIAIDYFGGGDPLSYYFGSRALPWSGAMGNPALEGIGYLAVSVNNLERERDAYGWLFAIRRAASGMGNLPTPDARAGTSIFIYHLSSS